ncbi:MAG: aminotransferase class V-fold PLP-dependent enzyme [Bacteroidetes bacterium]|nr:MAG: aminotransferase class V-fold PLP-dependent enzyme [Bacteroidota bacterium]
MSPLLKSVEEAGIEGLIRKRNPASIQPKDFFEGAEHLRASFGKLVNCSPQQVAIIPSVSYGMASAIKNLPVRPGRRALLVSDEFPSDVYSLQKWCAENEQSLVTISAPETREKRGETWNGLILEHINENTSVIVLSSVHWADGTLFDLAAIGARCQQFDVRLIVDGSQSVGALPMDVQAFHIDALICVGYKWMLGPYSLGLAYYGERINEGTPIEESWMNKSQAENFSRLTEYADGYAPGAARYNVGEFGNFISVPMLHTAIEQVLAWGVPEIQAYCRELTRPLAAFLRENGVWVEEEAYRAGHLLGFPLAPGTDGENVVKKLREKDIYVSLRGSSIRVSAHVYNTEADIEALVGALGSK